METMTDVDAAMDELEERLASKVAGKVVTKLAEMAGGFPSAEDIALIRDHISPNGVAYQNGKRAGRAEAAKEVRAAWNALGTDGILEWLDKWEER